MIPISNFLIMIMTTTMITMMALVMTTSMAIIKKSTPIHPWSTTEPSQSCLHGNQCVNGGRCIQEWSSHHCDCSMTSFVGSRCQRGSYPSPPFPGSIFPSDDLRFFPFRSPSTLYRTGYLWANIFVHYIHAKIRASALGHLHAGRSSVHKSMNKWLDVFIYRQWEDGSVLNQPTETGVLLWTFGEKF